MYAPSQIIFAPTSQMKDAEKVHWSWTNYDIGNKNIWKQIDIRERYKYGFADLADVMHSNDIELILPKDVQIQMEPASKKSKSKRSVGSPTDDPPADQNITTRSITVIDEDPNSDLKLKDCRIWEESEGEVIETHVYDFERNVLIEDNKVGGSSLNATYFEDGVEEDAEEVPAPETEEEI